MGDIVGPVAESPDDPLELIISGGFLQHPRPEVVGNLSPDRQAELTRRVLEDLDPRQPRHRPPLVADRHGGPAVRQVYRQRRLVDQRVVGVEFEVEIDRVGAGRTGFWRFDAGIDIDDVGMLYNFPGNDEAGETIALDFPFPFYGKYM